jgi:hypothetical protein
MNSYKERVKFFLCLIKLCTMKTALCYTSWKVVGSIPGEVIGFFYWPNPSSCTMALRSTHPLTEISTRNLLGVNGSWCMRLTTSLPSVSQLSRKCGSRQRFTTLWPPWPVNRESFTFFFFFYHEVVWDGGIVP